MKTKIAKIIFNIMNILELLFYIALLMSIPTFIIYSAIRNVKTKEDAIATMLSVLIVIGIFLLGKLIKRSWDKLSWWCVVQIRKGKDEENCHEGGNLND